MTVEPETISHLREILNELKNGRTTAVEELALVLWNGGVTWNIAIEAVKKREPKAFFAVFDRYRECSLDECAAAMRGVDYDFALSITAYEARSVSHWDFMYDSEVNNFFIAAIESILSRIETAA